MANLYLKGRAKVSFNPFVKEFALISGHICSSKDRSFCMVRNRETKKRDDKTQEIGQGKKDRVKKNECHPECEHTGMSSQRLFPRPFH